MGQVIHIFKKEFRGYFVSPIAYIVISIFLVVTGWFFFTTFFIYNQATIRNCSPSSWRSSSQPSP